MCFSATASFTSSALLAGIGILSLRSAKPKSLRFFASIPLFFAMQQAGEGLLWLSVLNNNQWLATISTYFYLFFALLFWPFWVPLSLFGVEISKHAKELLYFFIKIGIFFDLVMFAYGYLTASAAIVGNHIQYDIPGIENYYPLFLIWYCVATIVPFFIATYYPFRFFGIAVAFSLGYSSWYYYTYIVSVWCFFAALLSVSIWILVSTYPHKDSGSSD